MKKIILLIAITFTLLAKSNSKECLRGCQTCKSEEASSKLMYCVKCYPGHFIDMGHCYSCPRNCKWCTPDRTCRVCYQFFFKRNNQCVFGMFELFVTILEFTIIIGCLVAFIYACRKYMDIKNREEIAAQLATFDTNGGHIPGGNLPGGKAGRGRRGQQREITSSLDGSGLNYMEDVDNEGNITGVAALRKLARGIEIH